MSFDTQHHAEHLDRRKGLAILTDELLGAFDLTPDAKVFGENTALECRPTSFGVYYGFSPVRRNGMLHPSWR